MNLSPEMIITIANFLTNSHKLRLFKINNLFYSYRFLFNFDLLVHGEDISHLDYYRSFRNIQACHGAIIHSRIKKIIYFSDQDNYIIDEYPRKLQELQISPTATNYDKFIEKTKPRKIIFSYASNENINFDGVKIIHFYAILRHIKLSHGITTISIRKLMCDLYNFFPITVKKITIHDDSYFVELPDMLEELEMKNVTRKQMIEITKLQNLKKLTISSSYDINLPNSLKHIIVNSYYNFTNVPSCAKSIYIEDCDINNMIFPDTLEYLYFGDNFSQGIPVGIVPRSIKKIRFGSKNKSQLIL